MALLGQGYDADSLKAKLVDLPGDTSYVNTLWRLTHALAFSDTDQALKFGQQALSLAQNQQYAFGQVAAKTYIGEVLWVKGEYNEANEVLFEALREVEDLEDQRHYGVIENFIGCVVANQGDLAEGQRWFKRALKTNLRTNNRYDLAMAYNNVGITYNSDVGLPNTNDDSAIYYYKQGEALALELNHIEVLSLVYNNLGHTAMQRKQWENAIAYNQKAKNYSMQRNDNLRVVANLNNIGESHMNLNRLSLAEEYMNQAYDYAQDIGDPYEIGRCMRLLALLYQRQGRYQEALDLVVRRQVIVDSLESVEANARFQELKATYELEQEQEKIKRMEEEAIIFQQKLAINRSISIAVSLALGLVIIAFFLLRSQKKRTRLDGALSEVAESLTQANEQLQKQEAEITYLRKQLASHQSDATGGVSTETRNIVEGLRKQVNRMIGVMQLAEDMNNPSADELQRMLGKTKQEATAIKDITHGLQHALEKR